MTSAEITLTSDHPSNQSVQVAGQLWGGNLAMLAHLIGSPYLPQIEQGILFLEDINEHPFRIERMLLQLLHAGVLQNQQVIVLGDFSGGRLSAYDNGFDLDAVVGHLRSRITVPIVTGLQFGHVTDKVTLPVGAQATLNADRTGWSLHVEHYPHLT